MNFNDFNQRLQSQFNKMTETGQLFRSSITGQEVWDTYLSSFSSEDNPVFRDPQSSEHNCNCCKNFIRRYGNIVSINLETSSIESIFSNIEVPKEYQKSKDACDKLLVNSKISGVFFETFESLKSLPYESCKKNQEVFQLGTSSNFKQYSKKEVLKFGRVTEEKVYEFSHFHLFLPKFFVNFSGDSIEKIEAFYRDKYSVFKRAMEEISIDTLILVKDLITQGSLLDGTSHLSALLEIKKYKEIYDTYISQEECDLYCWQTSFNLSKRVAKFKNTLIGVLCSELSEGKELNKACEDWNKRVDPVNYHKAVAPITKRQIEDAKKFVQENGFEESFNRRLANLTDIKASEILHLNISKEGVKQVSVFDSLTPSGQGRYKRSEFDKVEEVSIEKFMKEILPNCTSVETFLENKMESNLVTLTTSINKDSKPIFKWSNNYSWTFNGNLAGKSFIKEAVKSRGGKTEGVLNIRLHFPNTISDYDLHVIEPLKDHIYYSNRRKVHRSSGMLDLDAQGCDGKFPPEKRVENIIYSDLSKMPVGEYLVFVNNYSQNDNNHGFTLEIEDNKRNVTSFVYDLPIRVSTNKHVCKIQLDSNGDFKIIPLIPIKDSSVLSKKVWNLDTNQFHKVKLICTSPNHWEENKAGNLHYFFMLENCNVDVPIRGFHNENLTEDLLKHRKVLEVLGNSCMIEPVSEQLSGLGFNSTVREELVVRVKGSFQRVLKIKF